VSCVIIENVEIAQDRNSFIAEQRNFKRCPMIVPRTGEQLEDAAVCIYTEELEELVQINFP